MLNTRSTFAAVLSVTLCLLLAACSTTDIINTLNVITDLAEVAAPIVVSYAGCPQCTVYVNAAIQGVDCGATELATTDTAAVKADKIVACFAGVAEPIFPNGTPAVVINIVKSLSNAIASFLAQYQTPKVQVVLKAFPNAQMKLTMMDRYHIGQIHVKVKKIQGILGTTKK